MPDEDDEFAKEKLDIIQKDLPRVTEAIKAHGAATDTHPMRALAQQIALGLDHVSDDDLAALNRKLNEYGFEIIKSVRGWPLR